MRSDPTLLHPSHTRSAPHVPSELPEPPPPEQTEAKAVKKEKKEKKAKRAKTARRRRPGPSVIAVVGLVLALIGADRPLARPGIEVSVQIAGSPRLLRFPEGTTAAEAFILADAEPRHGRLLSAASRSVLDPVFAPPGYAMNGLAVPPSTPLHSGVEITALEYPDEVESLTEVAEVVPAPPLPLIEKELWHPGRDGKTMVTKGVISGEETGRVVVAPPVPPAPVTAPWVALTFDDGPWAGSEAFLDVLRDKQVKAMFCVVGYTIPRPGHAGLLKRAVAEGHSLCNHTVNHDSRLPEKPADRINAEIADADRIITDHVGCAKPTFYRPPGGQLSPTVVDIAHRNGHRVLHWSVDPGDYADGKQAPEIFGRVMEGLKPGAVILLHDGGGDQTQTLVALGTLIDHIRAAGYQFVVPDQIAPIA